MPRTLALFLAAALVPAAALRAQAPTPVELARWTRESNAVTIVRDDWGIPHVHGHTDADAVFGMIYAQCEDDFNRVETNYIDAMGRHAEAEGASQVYRDLRMKLFIDPDSLKAEYAASPAWLKQLMDAFADGANYYLYKHPETKPRVITHFEPWMALAFTEGSIGGDIESVSIPALAAFYGQETTSDGAVPAFQDDPAPVPAGTPMSHGELSSGEALTTPDALTAEPTGSNGFAIAPKNTRSHHALLLINPHTSFFFRAELQMTSDEGLNAYGAVTWGQFFIYQGFNDRIGWMHTSSNADAIDEYAESIVRRGGRLYYRYGKGLRPVRVSTITVPYRTPTGMARRTFTVYYTQHGPVVRAANGRWIAVRLMQEPVKALIQSYTRTKARSYAQFRKTMELHTNSSNNTVFADADGDIAYFQANFIPRRDPRFDWTKPVDGSDPRTDWHGVLSIDESPHLLNPPNGWLFNTNDSPWRAAGPYSPKKQDYPSYVDRGSENPRGIHATMVLEHTHDFTLHSLIAAAFDSYLTEFAVLVPKLVAAYDALPAHDPLRARLAEPVDTLRHWNYRWGVASVPTAVAVFWGTALWRRTAAEARVAGISEYDYIEQRATAAERLAALVDATDTLTADFGSWKAPWGEINRFQRLTGDIVQRFDDAKPSIPVAFTSSLWGSLASFGARPYPQTKKWYGTSGNSFVAVVEFGDSVRARAVTAGGESGHPDSPHFDDEAERYVTGRLRDVYFYPGQLVGHTERRYHP